MEETKHLSPALEKVSELMKGKEEWQGPSLDERLSLEKEGAHFRPRARQSSQKWS